MRTTNKQAGITGMVSKTMLHSLTLGTTNFKNTKVFSVHIYVQINVSKLVKTEKLKIFT